MSLTGRTRLRAKRRLFRQPLLVLQVEERGQHVDQDGFGHIEFQPFVRWRDARVTDLPVSPPPDLGSPPTSGSAVHKPKR